MIIFRKVMGCLKTAILVSVGQLIRDIFCTINVSAEIQAVLEITSNLMKDAYSPQFNCFKERNVSLCTSYGV